MECVHKWSITEAPWRERIEAEAVGVVHGLGIIAALLEWLGPIQAAIIHRAPDVLVFVNSVKLLRVRIKGV